MNILDMLAQALGASPANANPAVPPAPAPVQRSPLPPPPQPATRQPPAAPMQAPPGFGAAARHGINAQAAPSRAPVPQRANPAMVAPAPLPSVPGTVLAEPGEGDVIQGLTDMLVPKGGVAPIRSGGGGPALPPDPKPSAGGVTASDVQNFIRAFSNGVSAVDPKAPIMKAIGQGAAGAADTQEATRRYAAKQAADAEESTFDRNLKTSAEARANRAEKRLSRHADAQESQIAAQIKKLNAETIKTLNPDLTVDQRINIERLARDNLNQLYKMKDNGDITEEEFNAQSAALRDNLMSRIKPVAPAGAGGSPVRVNTPEEARKLPPGTKIIMPSGKPGVVPGR
jgi:hypothetical protein